VGSLSVSASGSTDTVAGFADVNADPADVAVAGSLASANDGNFTGTLSGPGATANSASGSFVLYLINGTQGIGIETDMTQLNLSNFVRTQ
jgi:hypothetical protein